MKNNDFISLFKEVTSSYFVVENRFYKSNGEQQTARQYVAGLDAKRAYTVLPYDDNGNEYVAVNDADFDEPFCYSWLYRRKQRLNDSDYIFFNIKNPKDLMLRILKFLNTNAKNIEVDKMFYLKPSTSIILNQDNKSVKIAEVKKNRKTMWPNEYIHFNYRNIDINIVPITEKEFKFQTDRYNQWVEESIGSDLELQ